MENKKDLPLVEFVLKTDEGDDLEVVSIVKDPAIEKSFQLFKAVELFNKSNKELFKAKTDKQEITGPVMIPDLKILRYNKEKKEYFNCWFSAETVKECAALYLKNCNHTKANFDHLDNYSNNVYVIESWIVEDPENDKSKALGFTDVVPGTWFMTYKVDSPELWKTIKANGFTGFSIEGWFSQFANHKERLLYSVINSNLNDTDKESLIKKIINTAG